MFLGSSAKAGQHNLGGDFLMEVPNARASSRLRGSADDVPDHCKKLFPSYNGDTFGMYRLPRLKN